MRSWPRDTRAGAAAQGGRRRATASRGRGSSAETDRARRALQVYMQALDEDGGDHLRIPAQIAANSLPIHWETQITPQDGGRGCATLMPLVPAWRRAVTST